MFKDYFRDAMTETEKGRLHEALKQIRRMEFDTLVVKELMRDELVEKMDASQKELFDHQRHVTAQNKYTSGITGTHISTTTIGTTRAKP